MSTKRAAALRVSSRPRPRADCDTDSIAAGPQLGLNNICVSRTSDPVLSAHHTSILSTTSTHAASNGLSRRSRPEEMRSFVKTEIDKYAKLIRDSGMALQ